ncbi:MULTISPECIES: DUF4089 domain-containing protein [unclassified Nodosilinea]|uniref:DUF4089 domain-containing protein n=1 Tax=Leptolyngbya subtilissima DQ-A4 TaxID=2933933 RepID=A0ABV0K4G4_9CYAN|nr:MULTISPECIES: DUF4089 domain-containing protein [unclassified Nodosilinea]MBD2106794.1 DUF4089 domain-containing protein [Nodosilinea sp. FACHB-13]MBD2113610.1 DUF4089 domain-containing protein [Nodosilinea sp. FACHB-141]
MTSEPSDFDTATYVDLMAATLGLTIPDEIKAGVVANVEHIFAIAQPVLTFPLPDTIESAATFEP